MDALDLVDSWPATTVAVGVVGRDGRVLATRGPLDQPLRWASVTKLVTALAVLVAVEEGTIDLDDPAGPPGSTVRHLLAHASGLAFDRPQVLARPGTRRIYSNAGFDALGDALATAATMTFAEYTTEAVLEPLGLRATTVTGSPAHAAVGPLADLLVLARELLAPTLVAPSTLALATTVAFPDLPGIIPGLGRYVPCDWGLGFELRDGKSRHWTGTRNSPATFGHFGGSGSFLWVDPEPGLACACLSDLDFGPWAREAWPPLSDAVLARFG